MKHGPQRAAILAALIAIGFSATALAADAPVDSFDDGDVSDWTDFASGGSTMTHRLSSSHPQDGATALKLTYTIAAGGYAGVERMFATPPNWSGYGALQIWIYGAGGNDPLTVQIYDAGGERWEVSVPVTWYGWQLRTLPFSGFAKTGWQPGGTTQNNVRDLAGVRGMALIPTATAGMGQLYLDALSVTQSSGSPPASTASAPAPAPAPAPSATTGTIVPLYSSPSSPAWTELIAAKTAYPRVPVLAVLNPSNGPGSGVSTSYASGISRLAAAGVKVIGYVYTSYGSRPLAQVQADIDRWRTFYPSTTGIFFDEQLNRAGQEAYYKTLSTYAKSKGFDFTIGNPGSDSIASYVGTVDVQLIYESAGLPSMTRLGGWHAQYDKKNFGIIPYAVDTLDANFVASARAAVGYIFIQNDTTPNPWDTLPPYFKTLLSLLSK
jgi:hypothetical protein